MLPVVFPLFASFQTGEFSARFLLKLPVDFSNIPVYLLKVISHPTDVLHELNILSEIVSDSFVYTCAHGFYIGSDNSCRVCV